MQIPHVIVYIRMNNKEGRHKINQMIQIYVYVIFLWSVFWRKGEASQLCTWKPRSTA